MPPRTPILGSMLPIADSDLESARTRRSDTLLALLAAVATLAFAWSGFQSAEWVRERFQRSDAAAAMSEDALKISAEADRLEERDTILFVEWLLALDSTDVATAEVVFELFRPQIQDYLRTVTLDENGAPEVPPFESPQYDVTEMRAEAAELEGGARAENALSRTASENGARYGALGVMFAAVLASVGIATRFSERRVRMGLTAVAGLLCAVGLVYLAFSPLSFSI
jgi:hypothetical protein